MKKISALELKKMIEDKEDFQLIDVREISEYNEQNIGGLNIVLGDILRRKEEVDKNKKVVVHCRSGKRSATAISVLDKQGYKNLYNLEGGIIAWNKIVKD